MYFQAIHLHFERFLNYIDQSSKLDSVIYSCLYDYGRFKLLHVIERNANQQLEHAYSKTTIFSKNIFYFKSQIILLS